MGDSVTAVARLVRAVQATPHLGDELSLPFPLLRLRDKII
jgi:hypothetical protein